MTAVLSSGDLARATGNTVRAIRHYEAEGLLPPAEVSDGGHRRYGEAELERLRLIGDLRAVGLPLREIRAILELRSGCQTASEFAARFRRVVEVHLGEAQRQLERLRRVRREILDAMAVVEERLRANGGVSCPCSVAGTDGVPRIVKVLASHHHCSCGGPVHRDRAWGPRDPGPDDEAPTPLGHA